MDDDEKLGRRIRMIREARGMSQAELAEKTGVSLQEVQNWEETPGEDTRRDDMRRLGQCYRLDLSY